MSYNCTITQRKNALPDDFFSNHPYALNETIELTRWINYKLKNNEILFKNEYLPISEEGNDLFASLTDGIILKHLFDLIQPNSIQYQ